MITYVKNMEGWNHKDLRSKDFDSIKELFNKAFKRVNTFVDYKTELVEESSKKAEIELEENLQKAEVEVMEGSSKRAGEELEQENANKQKVAVDDVPLATKPPTIVDWKIHKKGKKSYYQIIRADGSLKMYLVFSHMLKNFNREDLETLYKLVKAKYGSTRPVENLDLILYGDLKAMFEPHVEDVVWRNQQGYKVLEWKLYDSCRKQATVQNGGVVVQNIQGRQIRVQGNNARGAAAAGNGGAQYRAGNENARQGKPIKCYNYNEIDLDEEQLLCLAADQCDTFDFDVNEAPSAQTVFLANLSSANPVYDEVGPSFDSDTLSEVQDHDNCLDNINKSHEDK
ncbi:hypothetical protein Tco_1108127 [Tanacetum coccineum]